ncbi:ABC transporter substrate-binding protein [Marmoricola endophyticus]|uniref:ABC transporter substrate-binding protein n=1 Tax=Marmoricola endophyticus TaxID=2040280 RepID=A0A917F2U1_9ACTN|nr:MCE family protein [Marmoricola endophyticus]GGF37494.1 ABC transporter substrate-binding protein [Marmoricola endophyticus]
MRLLPDRSFQERNLKVIATIGTVALVVLFALAFNLSRLPVVGAGTTYHAAFSEAAGLKEGDEVRLAGVKVGEVQGMHLDGKQIMVDFAVKDTWVGSSSSASIAIKTLLGQKYLALDSTGSTEMEKGGTIPLSRTTAPYDVTQTLSRLSSQVSEIDTGQLEQSFDALSSTFENTPDDLRGTLDGLTALSKTISTRDQQIAELLANTAKISQVLRERRAQIGSLIQDGNRLLAELQQRRQTISDLLRGTAELGTQLQGLVADNQDTLRPALAKLDRVSEILSRNQTNLDSAVKLLGPYYRVLTSAIGNGPWIDVYACGLFQTQGPDAGYPQLDNDVARNCNPGGKGGAQ